MRARSPARHAENFTAPVLLIHGDDDRVVKFDHSKQMERALKRAEKSVKLVRIKKAGHGLLDGDERVTALREMSDFVDQHIGPGAAQ